MAIGPRTSHASRPAASMSVAVVIGYDSAILGLVAVLRSINSGFGSGEAVVNHLLSNLVVISARIPVTTSG